MKYLFIFLMICFGLNPSKVFAQDTFDAKFKAKEVIDLFKQEKFAEAYNQMSAIMKRKIDVEQLQGIWDGLIMQYDTIQSIGEPVVSEKDTFIVTVTPVHFNKTKLGLQLTFEPSHKICGIFIVPLTYPYQPADYVNTSRFYEVKKNVPDPAFPSEGVLTIPNGNKKVPLIIIVGGSGPTDKDLTMGSNKIYKDFAWGLAAKGIAVYRYDKRTFKFGAELAKNKNVTVNEEYLLDLKLIVKMLIKKDEIDAKQIYIMGHSEGGYLLPYFAKNLSGIKGYLSLAGNYSKLTELIPKHISYRAMQMKNIEEKNQILKEMPKALYARDRFTKESPDDSLPFGFTTAYLWYLNENSPQKIGKALMKKPVFFLQGARDYQVTPDELDLWKMTLAQSTEATFKMYPALNHIFLSGTGLSNPAEYEKPGNVPEEVINDIASWVLQ